jgi:hypothetical protein
MYAMTHFRVGILTQETCTQVLQTFHHCKKHVGTPVKVAKLDLRQKRAISKFDALSTFDPRPKRLRNRIEYPSQFRSIVLNSSMHNFAICQLYPPANIRAVAHDHDYLTECAEKNFLSALNVTAITAEQTSKIEIETRGQSKNKL